MQTVIEVLRAAAADGHTALPEPLAAAYLAGRGVRRPESALAEAHETGKITRRDGWVALPPLAAAEDAIAATAGRVRCVDVSAATAEEVAAELDDGEWFVIDHADRLDATGLATALAEAPDEVGVLLVGDPALPPPVGAGQPYLDLRAALGFDDRTGPAGDPIAELCAAVRAGDLPRVDGRDKSVVIVPAADGHAAAHRAGQLVGDSIPRVFGYPPDEVAVVTPIRRGPAGADALRAAGLPAYPLAAALGRRWAAVVVVVPPEACGLLSRPVVYGLCSRAAAHLSVVHAAGPVLARAVRVGAARRRRTRLPRLVGGG